MGEVGAERGGRVGPMDEYPAMMGEVGTAGTARMDESSWAVTGEGGTEVG